ncbi:hypothetical protein HanLR1_Chr17g0659491 [Helianthus annuus]|nr:hypothetical protein HanHA89_Chr17g0700841 [Helianthus annuus]KAJ0631936.1 hypothetical protein HanLR1_Chr17g0659491 [Helianthus annuus]
MTSSTDLAVLPPDAGVLKSFLSCVLCVYKFEFEGLIDGQLFGSFIGIMKRD